MGDKGKWLLSGILTALAIGLTAGWFRYWFGYFVLGQGVLAGLMIPWLSGKFLSETTLKHVASGNPKTVRVALGLFLCFMIAQAVGFGLSQPWFDPLGWAGRILSGHTSEHVFGLSLLGGAVGRNFRLGANGGFWVFLTLFDLFFMAFFLLVGTNIQLEKVKR